MIGPLLFLASAVSAGVLPEVARLGEYAEPMRITVEHPTVHQVVGPIETPLSPQVSEFLLDHPDMSAWLVRRHGIAPYVIEMRGPDRSWADDGDGTTGFIGLAARAPGERAYYTEGTHVSALFPDIKAAAVVLMEIRPVVRDGCPPHVVSSFDVYVKMRSRFVSAMVKALKPFIKRVLIRKFTKAFSVAQQVGVLLAREPKATAAEILSYPGFSDADRARAAVLLDSVEAEPAACRGRP